MNNTAQSIIRVAALLGLVSVALACLFTIPDDGCSMTFFVLSMLTTKAIAYYGFRLAHSLYERWKANDPLIRRYDSRCNKALGAPNPARLGDAEEGE